MTAGRCGRTTNPPAALEPRGFVLTDARMNQARHERAEREPGPVSPFEVEDHTDPEQWSDLLEVLAAARWVQEERAQGRLPN